MRHDGSQTAPGAERALPYADSVSDNITWQAKALTAVYEQGFAEKLLKVDLIFFL